MNNQTCDGCDRPTAGAKLCEQCSKTLAICLPNLAAYYEDLDIVEAKATRYASNTSGNTRRKDADERGGDWQQGAPEKPLPVDDRFLDAIGVGTQVRWDVWNSVTTWARVIMDEQPRVAGATCGQPCLHVSCSAIRRRAWPRTNKIRSLAAYFDRQFRHITSADWASEFMDEMLDNENRMRRLIDRPADRWYAGRCLAEDEYGTCTAELYAVAGERFIYCPTCGIEHNVAERREKLLKEAEDHLVTATQAAKALLAWTDYDGTEGRLTDKISKWRDRHVLWTRGVVQANGRDRHLYRLGDIQDLLIGSTRDMQKVVEPIKSA